MVKYISLDGFGLQLHVEVIITSTFLIWDITIMLVQISLMKDPALFRFSRHGNF